VFLDVGNAGTKAITDLLSRSRRRLLDFDADDDAAVFELSREVADA